MIISVNSCKDDDQSNGSSNDLRVEVISPQENAVFNSGESILLKFNISASNVINSYKVVIRDKSDNSLKFILSKFSSDRLIEIDTTLNLETSIAAQMDIEVSAEDSFGNELDEVVQSFTLNPPLGNTLGLRFNLTYEGETLLMGKRYIYPTGEEFEFSRFDMYISELSLGQGNNLKLIKEVDYLIMTQTYRDVTSAKDGYLYRIAGIEDGNYDTLQFNIGLTPDMNATTPSDYPINDPLGRSGEYWEGWKSYIFASIEGRINLDTANSDFEQGIALHLGSNDALQEIKLIETIDLFDSKEKIIDINIELKDLFVSKDGEIYDIATTPQTHSLSHIPLIITLSRNLKNALKN